MEKLLEAMTIEPEIVSYLGLSEAIIKNQAKFMEKFEAIKVEELFSVRVKRFWVLWALCLSKGLDGRGQAQSRR